MTEDEAKTSKIGIDAVAAGLRCATQLVDRISEFTGVPYRPPWAQPLRDGWEQAAQWSGVVNNLERRLSQTTALLEQFHPHHPQPEICDACRALGRFERRED